MSIPPPAPAPTPPALSKISVDAHGVVSWAGHQWRLLSEGQTVFDPELVKKALSAIHLEEIPENAFDSTPQLPQEPTNAPFTVFVDRDGHVTIARTISFESPNEIGLRQKLSMRDETVLVEISQAHDVTADLMRKLQKYNSEDIVKALDRILSEVPSFEAQTGMFGAYERTLLQSLLEKENRYLLEALHELRYLNHSAKTGPEASRAGSAHAERLIREELVSRLQRKPRDVVEGLECFQQKFKAPGSSLAALTRSDVVEHSPIGTVSIRSGSTGSLEKVEELVRFAAQTEASQENFSRKGLYKDTAGRWHFRHHSTSLLNSGKADEQKQLRDVLHGCDAFAAQPNKTVRMKIGTTEHDVILDPPIVSLELFSASPVGEGVKRRMNELSTLRLLQAGPPFTELEGLMKAEREKLDQKLQTFGKPFPPARWSQEDWVFQQGNLALIGTCKEAYDAFITQLQKNLEAIAKGTSADKLRAKAFLVHLTGKDEAGLPVDPIDQEIYRNILLEQSGISSSKQCRDGVEKTGIAVALQEAQALFRKGHNGTEFLPGMSDPALADFKKTFTKALMEHGVSVFAETKGYSALALFRGASCFDATKMSQVQKYLDAPDLALGLSRKRANERKSRASTLWKDKLSLEDKREVVKSTKDALGRSIGLGPWALPFVFSEEDMTVSRVNDSYVLSSAQKTAIQGKIQEQLAIVTAGYTAAKQQKSAIKQIFGWKPEDPLDKPEIQRAFCTASFLQELLETYPDTAKPVVPTPAPQLTPPPTNTTASTTTPAPQLTPPSPQQKSPEPEAPTEPPPPPSTPPPPPPLAPPPTTTTASTTPSPPPPPSRRKFVGLREVPRSGPPHPPSVTRDDIDFHPLRFRTDEVPVQKDVIRDDIDVRYSQHTRRKVTPRKMKK